MTQQTDAALLDQLRAQIAELLAIIGASTPIAAFDLATTWRAEKALMQDEIAALGAERDAIRTDRDELKAALRAWSSSHQPMECEECEELVALVYRREAA